MYASVRNLIAELIDYAGLFPPAKLDMPTAVRSFERYRSEEFGWVLGRFIVPAARLDEIESSFPVSVLMGPDLDRDVAAVNAFMQRHPGAVKSVESRQDLGDRIPVEIPMFVEIPLPDSRGALLSPVSEQANCAKIRTGGLTPEAFPQIPDLVRFLQLSSILSVPFKATAGLHHAIRGSYKLTYEPDSPTAVMHGFLNLFLAAGFVRSHMKTELVTELMEEQSSEAFRFSEDGVTWRDQRLSTDEISEMRRTFAVSFGSCSFEEPIEELRKMGLL